MADHNATDPVSRRNVLKTAGGLLAGSTMLASFGAERSGALPDRHGPLRIEIEELTEEYIAVRVRMSEELYERINERGALADRVFLGLGDQFVIHDDEAVSIGEDPDNPANPVEMKRLDEATYVMYFRTGDIVWPKEYEGDEVTLGLGVFPERTVPEEYFDAVSTPIPPNRA